MLEAKTQITNKQDYIILYGYEINNKGIDFIMFLNRNTAQIEILLFAIRLFVPKFSIKQVLLGDWYSLQDTFIFNFYRFVYVISNKSGHGVHCTVQ